MLLFLMLAAATAEGPSDPVLESVLAFGNSTSYPLKAEKCKLALPELSDDFDESLKAWRKENKAKIKAGREVIAAEGRRTGVDTVRMTQDNQVWLEKEFSVKSAEEQAQRCKQLLAEIQGK